MEKQDKNLQKKKPSSLKPQSDSPSWGGRIYAKYSAIGFQMAALILCGLFGGMKLDEVFELPSPVFTVVLTFLGFGAALYFLFQGITKK